MSNYSTILKELIEEQEYIPEEIVDVVSNADHDFKTFSELLRREIRLKYPDMDERLTLKQALKDKEIPFNRNTLDNWFDDMVPKMSSHARDNMYKIAFALELSEIETIRLFKKVYKDRPFDLRRIEEFVYYICLKNKYTYQYAQEILDEIELVQNDENHIEHTSVMLQVANTLKTKESILEYVKQNANNFFVSNVSAKRVLNSLIDDIIVKKNDKKSIKGNSITDKHSIIAQEIKYNPDLIVDNLNLSSISAMLTIIYGVSNDIELRQHNLIETDLPKEILKRLPTKHTFSKENPTYEELRKSIILLASYKFWIISQYIDNDYTYELDDYVSEINSYLLDANMSELYVGNIFDWFFMYCSVCSEKGTPIELFRAFMNTQIL